MIGVYAIVHRDSGRRYIGSSKNVERRWYEHTRLLGMGRHGSRHLQHAWAYYGAEAFDFVVVETCALDALVMREQAWLDVTMSADGLHGFNLSADARMPSQTPEVIERSASKRRGQKRPGVGAKIAAKLRGRKLTPEHAANIGRGVRGIKRGVRTEEHRQKLRDAALRRVYAPLSQIAKEHIRASHWARSANAEQVIAQIKRTKEKARANNAPPKEAELVVTH